MPNNENLNKQLAEQINKCKKDAAAGDSGDKAMPVFDDILKKKPEKKEFISNIVEKIGQNQPEDKSENMPSLDLGVQILAQQRKIAALKRKSPAPAKYPAVKPLKFRAVPVIPMVNATPASPQQKIIADIVAKQIAKLSAAR